jgi:hypothetical protein
LPVALRRASCACEQRLSTGTHDNPLDQWRLLVDGDAWLDHGGFRIIRTEIIMANEKGPNIKKKQKCKNCEGKGLLKKGDRVVKCQRCKGTGVR